MLTQTPFASGAHSNVFEAYRGDQELVIKVYNSPSREPSILQKVHPHKNIVHYFPNIRPSCCASAPHGYVVLERLQATLDWYLKGCWNIDDPVQYCRIVRQILAALKHVHSLGIIHNDLHPGNILVQTHKGTQFVSVKLCDFSCSVTTSEVKATENVSYGNMTYGPPSGELPSPAADMYALGSIMNAMRGFRADEKTIPFFSKDHEKLVTSLLSPTPQNRPTADQALHSPFLNETLRA